ncbi:MAG: hypothetical protein EXS55_04545 [Candidatus Magasanikbacteria bacterium]|nr:hypothetical protein [Candidatus Magasanikbacteria bacterium]
MLEKLLARLDLDESEIKTYVALLGSGPIPASVLAKKSGHNRVTEYVILDRLIHKGFVLQSQKLGIKTFAAITPERVSALYREKIATLESDYRLYKSIVPELESKMPAKLLAPKFQVFEGVEGLKNVLKDMLMYKDIETQAYWPIKKMVEILSPEFFRYHNKERIKNNVYTRAIWPKREAVEIKSHPYLGAGEKFKREIRIAPPEINFSMGYWIYGNKVAFLSSRKESFGYIMESVELVEMLLSQFEVMWRISKPLPMKLEEVGDFLKEIQD